MKARALTLSATFLALSFAAGCDKKDEGSGGGISDSATKSDDQKAAKKKETVDALLRENGIDPETVKNAGAAPKGAPTPGDDKATQAKAGGAPDEPSAGSAKGNRPQATVEVLSEGSGPKKMLKYQFEKGRTRKFSMDMTITPKRSVNGQPMPTMPGVTIALSGNSKTTSIEGGNATRLNTFTEFTPGTEGLPPMMVEQMTAQFSALKGTQLSEVVSSGGQVLDIRLPPDSAQNPQLIALLQNLQDGMTNSFVPLPDKAVGVGAKWNATHKVNVSGISVTQENLVTLKSMNGDKITVELAFKQSAPPQKIQAAELPPGADVELTGMTGGGQGTMTVDLKSLVTESKVDLNMTVDTKISGIDQPEPLMSSTDTNMKIHLKITE